MPTRRAERGEATSETDPVERLQASEVSRRDSRQEQGLIRRPVGALVEINRRSISRGRPGRRKAAGPSQIGLRVLGVIVEREGPIADGCLVASEGHQGQGAEFAR